MSALVVVVDAVAPVAAVATHLRAADVVAVPFAVAVDVATSWPCVVAVAVVTS